MKEINECIGDIGKTESIIFATLDLTSGFWQMPMNPKDFHLTAFTIHGQGQFKRITSPMGLLGCPASFQHPASFQRLMEKAMEGITSCIVYIDDFLMHTNTHYKHFISLDEVMS